MLSIRYTRLAGIFFFFFLNQQCPFTQTGDLTGKVVLTGTQTPVPDLFVYLEKTEFGGVTNQAGEFAVTQVPEGRYTLLVSAIGFIPVEDSVVVTAGSRLEVRLEIAEAVVGLPEVMVQSVSLTGGLRGLRELPGAGHYLAPKELERFSHTDINRVLQSVPGVNLREEDGFGLRPNIGLRGTGSERSSKITIMEDGVLAAPAPYSAPAAYYFPTMGRMRAVEILKGSSQIRFGPFTTGGAINLISTPVPEQFSGRIHLLGGSYGNRSLHAAAGNSHRNVGYMVESFQYQSNGFKELPGGENTGFDKKDYLAKFRVNTGPGARVYQSLMFKIGQSDESSGETYLGLAEADFDQNPAARYAGSQQDLMTTRHRQYALQHAARFSESVDLITTAYRSDFHRNWYKLDKMTASDGSAVAITDLLDYPERYPESFAVVKGATSLNDNALQVKANNRTYRAQGLQTVLGIRFATGETAHSLDIGLRYHYDEMDRFQWVDNFRMLDGVMALTQAGTPGTESNRIESARALASYLQYKLKTGRWTFIPGLRYENMTLKQEDYGKNDPGRTGAGLSEVSNQEAVFIPGLGVNYRLAAAIDLFAGIHRGFSPPGTSEGSRPEESVNYELGARYRRGGFNGQAVVFVNDYRNLLGADLAASGGGGTGELFNGGKTLARGLEVQFTCDLLSSGTPKLTMPVTLAYTFTYATFRSSFDSNFEGWGMVESGDELPYVAPHQLALMWSLQARKFDVNISGRFQDAMRTQAGQGPIPAGQGTDAYVVLDASARYNAHQNIAFFASASNLLDAAYVVARRPAGLRPGLPRALMAGVKVDF